MGTNRQRTAGGACDRQNPARRRWPLIPLPCGQRRPSFCAGSMRPFGQAEPADWPMACGGHLTEGDQTGERNWGRRRTGGTVEQSAGTGLVPSAGGAAARARVPAQAAEGVRRPQRGGAGDQPGSRARLLHPASGNLVSVKHGGAGYAYNKGCRCDVCVEAWNARAPRLRPIVRPSSPRGPTLSTARSAPTVITAAAATPATRPSRRRTGGGPAEPKRVDDGWQDTGNLVGAASDAHTEDASQARGARWMSFADSSACATPTVPNEDASVAFRGRFAGGTWLIRARAARGATPSQGS